MHRLRQAVADAGDRAEQVGARAQVGEFAQVLQRVLLGLHGIGERVLDPADHLDRRRLDLETLALALGGHQRAGGDDRTPGGQMLDLGFVVGQRIGCHHLDRREARAVADVDEGQTRLGIAPRAHPAAHRDLAAGRELARQRMFDAHHRHGLNPSVTDIFMERGV